MSSKTLSVSSRDAGRLHPASRIKWSPQADARLARFNVEGLSLRAMAGAFGISRSAIAVRAGRLGLEMPTRPAPAPRKPALLNDPLADPNRAPLPAGHPFSWDLINHGTCLEGVAYQCPLFARLGGWSDEQPHHPAPAKRLHEGAN